MNAFKYTRLDWARCRGVSRYVLIGGIALAFFITKSMENVVAAVGYLLFICTLVSVHPFTMEQISDAGFVNMLPGTKKQKVIGRYLYTIILFLGASVVGIGVMLVGQRLNLDVTRKSISMTIAIYAAFFIVCCLQNMAFFCMGKLKSQQLMGIIQMVPAFVMWFGLSKFLDYVEENPNADLSWLTWIMKHSLESSLLLVLVSIIICIIGIEVSEMAIKRRDLA